MASSVICIGQRQACALRATRLNADCTPAEGADNAVVTAALATLTLEPQVEEGQTFNPPNACGDYLWSAEDPDRILRYTGDGELVLYDYELIELMTDSALLTGAVGTPWAGDNAGVAYPGPASTPSPGVCLEIWVKNAGVGDEGPCGPSDSHPPYTRYVLYRCRVRPGGRTFNGEASMFTFSIKVGPNPQWGTGPWGDWNVTQTPDINPVAQFYDDALPDTGCGYIEVPAGSGS